MKIRKFINQYKIYIYFALCFFIVIRIIFGRYNSIFIRPDKNYIPSFFVLVFVIISWIILCYKWYINRNYPNRNTLIKKFINNNPRIKQGILKSIEIYEDIYTNRIIDIDVYLSRFKIYRIIQSMGGNFRNSYFIFIDAVKKREYKNITFISIVSFIFEWFTIFIGIYNIILIYIYNILSYSTIAIFFISLMIRRIVKYWDYLIDQKQKIIDMEINMISIEIEKVDKKSQNQYIQYKEIIKHLEKHYNELDNINVSVSDSINKLYNRIKQYGLKEKTFQEQKEILFLRDKIHNEKDKFLNDYERIIKEQNKIIDETHKEWKILVVKRKELYI